MKTKTFRPKSISFILMMIICVSFLAFIGIGLLVVGIIEKNMLYCIGSVPMLVFMVIAFLSLAKYKIVITENYISALNVNANTRSLFGRYSKKEVKVLFNEVKSFSISFEFVNMMRFIFFVFKHTNDSIKKIDTKLFSKKQFQKMKKMLKEKIEEEKEVL